MITVIGDGVNWFISNVNYTFDYLFKNALHIGILVAFLLIIKEKVLHLFNGNRGGYVLHSAELDSGTDNGDGQIKTDEDRIREIRERQQQLADERAKEAAIEMKKKQIEEKQRKNSVAKSRQQLQMKGDILGGNGRNNRHNPVGNPYR